MLVVRTLAVAAVFTSLAGSVAAQSSSSSADERAIRDLIARYDKGERISRSDDSVLWAGDSRRPTLGSQPREPLPADEQPSVQVGGAPARTPNSRRRITTPVRIEVATSGELAYEFSDSELTFDLENGAREAILSSVLRVWKKDAGQWKIAAMFARPHYREAATPGPK